MKKIEQNNMSLISGGEINCEQGGYLFGMGAAFMSNPVTAGAGLLILMFGTAALVTGDCEF